MKTFWQFLFAQNFDEAASLLGSNSAWQKFVQFLASQSGDENWLHAQISDLRDYSPADKQQLAKLAYLAFGGDMSQPNDDRDVILAILGVGGGNSWTQTSRNGNA